MPFVSQVPWGRQPLKQITIPLLFVSWHLWRVTRAKWHCQQFISLMKSARHMIKPKKSSSKSGKNGVCTLSIVWRLLLVSQQRDAHSGSEIITCMLKFSAVSMRCGYLSFRTKRYYRTLSFFTQIGIQIGIQIGGKIRSVCLKIMRKLKKNVYTRG